MVNPICFSRREVLSWRVLSAAVLLFTLSACGEDASKSSTQVAARVGDTELTVHQVNDEMVRQPQFASVGAEGFSRQALEVLINQQVVANKALENELDRDPSVMQAIERAKRMILVQAYMDRNLGKPAVPTDVEVGQYYESRPELFAQRRSYNLRQLSIPANLVNDKLMAKLNNSSSRLDDIVEALKEANIPFGDEQITRLSEDLSMPLVKQISNLQEGERIVITDQGPNIDLVELLSSSQQAVTEQQAAAAIRRFIQTQKHNEAVDAEVKRLRATTNIEYLGEFALGEADEPAALANKSEKNEDENQENEFIDRGVAGFGK